MNHISVLSGKCVPVTIGLSVDPVPHCQSAYVMTVSISVYSSVFFERMNQVGYFMEVPGTSRSLTAINTQKAHALSHTHADKYILYVLCLKMRK